MGVENIFERILDIKLTKVEFNKKGKTFYSRIPDTDYLEEFREIYGMFSDLSKITKTSYPDGIGTGITGHLLDGTVDLLEYMPKKESDESFYAIFTGCIKNPSPLPSETGKGDIQINSVIGAIGIEKDKFKILDVGCGEGRFICELNTLDNKTLENMTYIGLDIYDENLKKAETYAKKVGFAKKIDSIEFHNQQSYKIEELAFKYIFVINVLHEIQLKDLTGFINLLTKGVTTGGYIILHDMIKLPKAEKIFLTWDEEDLKAVFKDDKFDIRIRRHKSRKGIPLFTAIISNKSAYSVEEIAANCRIMYKSKKEKTLRNIEKLKAEKTTRKLKGPEIKDCIIDLMWLYALNANIDIQIKEVEKQ